jgi:hypothetical protein
MPSSAFAWSNRSPRDRSAYVARNRDDSRAILTVPGGANRIAVAADAFTAQLLFPL